MRWIIHLSLFFFCLSGWASQSLQAWLDAAPAGSHLRLPAGNYRGPAVLKKPLSVEGDGQVTIDAEGKGTVLTVKASDVTLRGLRFTGSGGSHDALDAGVVLSGNHIVFENNVVDDVLFGVLLHDVHDSRISANRIRSRPIDAAERGDGLRIWNSTYNLIDHNDIRQIRDQIVLAINQCRNLRHDLVITRRPVSLV